MVQIQYYEGMFEQACRATLKQQKIAFLHKKQCTWMFFMFFFLIFEYMDVQ